MIHSQKLETKATEAQAPSLHRLQGSATDQKCSCDGDGWIVTLDRDRYKSPGDAGMVRYTRCVCIEQALSILLSA